jgi:hypothetical protein
MSAVSDFEKESVVEHSRSMPETVVGQFQALEPRERLE